LIRYPSLQTTRDHRDLAKGTTTCDHRLNFIMQKVSNENDEGVSKEMGDMGNMELDGAVRTGMGNEGKSGMWTATKLDSDPTAQESLQAIARRADAQQLNETTGLRAIPTTLYRNMPTTERLITLITTKPSVTPLKEWLWGLSKFILP
jgi:hypothetical protein